MLLQSKLLNQFSELVHGFTTRELGDDISKIAKELDVSEEKIVTVKQIHSNRVLVFPFLKNSEADAMSTHQSGLFIGIRTADCVPLLIYDPQKKVCAAVHAGWRGLIGGVIENTIQQLCQELSSHPKSLVVALGPALCPGCFEIGPEVKDRFVEKFGTRLIISSGETDRSFLDLREACRLVLLDAGVLGENIEHLSYCNFCQPDLFYSYRRGDKLGRQLALIGLK